MLQHNKGVMLKHNLLDEPTISNEMKYKSHLIDLFHPTDFRLPSNYSGIFALETANVSESFHLSSVIATQVASQ